MRYFVACLAVLAGLLTATHALAARHGGIYASIGAQTGYVLQPLMHDQLRPMDANRDAVVALAQKHLPYDTMAQTLVGFIGEQRQACAYGMVPANIAGLEASPLHLCTHAFLAGTQALLEHLRNKAPADDVNTLYAKVFAEGGLVGCVYSARTFNTDDIIHVDLHLDDIALGGGGLLLLVLLVAPLRRRRAAVAA